MPFLKRLGYYLAGLSVGLIFLAFFLKKKSEETGVSFCYLPNCRVLKDLRSKPHLYSDEVSRQIQSQELDTTGLSLVFLEGDINFKKSNPRGEPCAHYTIEGTLNKSDVSLEVISCKDEVFIEEINLL